MNAIEDIYQKYAKTVYGFLLIRTNNPDLAEELTQETFYQAVKSIKKFKGDSSVSTWLCAIAKNIWYGYRKKNCYSSLEEAENIGTSTVEEDFISDWDNIKILKILHQLENPMKEVVYLRLIGNLSFRDIGEIMEQSENWARVNFYRGKEKIVKGVKENES